MNFYHSVQCKCWGETVEEEMQGWGRKRQEMRNREGEGEINRKRGDDYVIGEEEQEEGE